MAIGIEDSGRKFITTEPIGKDGEHCEQIVWDTVKETFAKRTCLAYWRYPIFVKTGETRKEPDILIADKELGITIIEVKSINIEQIIAVNGHYWEFQNFYQAQGNPYEQAENQLYALLGYCNNEPAIRKQVTGRAIVALPFITEKQWQEKGFDKLPSCPPIIFKEHLTQTNLLKRIQNSPPVEPRTTLDDKQWEILLAVLGGTPVLRQPTIKKTATTNQTRSSIIATLRERLYELDLQQEHIGKEIPPGPQRIRGIAGSGKTVLLCQKAAHMHCKHPEWDIALVFFTRSLYDQVEGLVRKWITRFGGTYNPNKLRILHAWGAKDRPGLYRTIFQHHYPRLKPLTVADTSCKQPNEGLADVCKRLIDTTEIKPMFDAILIDEGQDLVVDTKENRQAIYSMAYAALKPCDRKKPEIRRLIWAYDEAQSLYALKIPQYKDIFGEPLSSILTKGSIYRGGIKKNEIMHRCYRTPGPILTAAHAIGMGLLRPEGMLSGITNADDWRTIGYEVTGDFRRRNEQITLHRPPHNSPNPVPDLWQNSTIDFETYDSRQEELTTLAQEIRYNLEQDKLQPHRQILVIVLGSVYDAMALETYTASFLMQQGINIFIPSALKLNQIKPKWPNNDPDSFWHEGGVTVSRIDRVKGNEADMVYVLGFDQVAKTDTDIKLRNQLFVALTRARGWVKLSGIGDYPLYDEMQRVIASGNTFTFTNKGQQLIRNLSEEIPELPAA